jgi:hypothetical protein
MSFGEWIDQRLATLAVHVAVQPNAEGSLVGHLTGEKLATRDLCNIYCYLRLHCLQPDRRQPRT